MGRSRKKVAAIEAELVGLDSTHAEKLRDEDASKASGSKKQKKRLKRTAEKISQGGDNHSAVEGRVEDLENGTPVPNDASPISVRMAKKLRRKARREEMNSAQSNSSAPAVTAAAAAASAEIDDIFASRRPTSQSNSSSATTIASKDKRKHPAKAARTKAPRGSAEDPLGNNGGWVDDGLGGVYDRDGWTGRRTSGDNYRIFKTHLLKIGEGGGTPLCPFDCDCCF
mmetsp:Transcript_110618/g.173043  ORF Transcript_110618/g.173043 Transcript_110618/m.173043 type:complete len:226 (-) Transcript_110618:60-737(-)